MQTVEDHGCEEEELKKMVEINRRNIHSFILTKPLTNPTSGIAVVCQDKTVAVRSVTK